MLRAILFLAIVVTTAFVWTGFIEDMETWLRFHAFDFISNRSSVYAIAIFAFVTLVLMWFVYWAIFDDTELENLAKEWRDRASSLSDDVDDLSVRNMHLDNELQALKIEVETNGHRSDTLNARHAQLEEMAEELNKQGERHAANRVEVETQRAALSEARRLLSEEQAQSDAKAHELDNRERWLAEEHTKLSRERAAFVQAFNTLSAEKRTVSQAIEALKGGGRRTPDASPVAEDEPGEASAGNAMHPPAGSNEGSGGSPYARPQSAFSWAAGQGGIRKPFDIAPPISAEDSDPEPGPGDVAAHDMTDPLPSDLSRTDFPHVDMTGAIAVTDGRLLQAGRVRVTMATFREAEKYGWNGVPGSSERRDDGTRTVLIERF